MKKEKAISADTSQLRRRAEEKLKVTETEAPLPIAEPDVLRLVNELQVHQIELKLQNQELLQARDDTNSLLELYAELYDFAPVGYFTLDYLGSIRKVNLTGSSLLGVNRSRLVNGSFTLFTSPETRPIFNTMLKNVFEIKKKQTCELTLLTETGTPIFVQIDADVSKDCKECRLAVIDISERKRAEYALAHSEERYRTVADFTYDWEYWLAPDGSFVYVSPSCERITGYKAEDYQKNPGLLVSIVHPDYREMVAQHVADISKGMCHLDFHIFTKSGEKRWISHACQSVHNQDGTYLGHRASNRDITERKQIEEALQESENRFRTIFQDAPLGIALIDSYTGNICELNQRFADIAGRTIEEMKTIDWMSITHSDDVQEDLDQMSRLNAGEITGFHMDKRYLRPDGSVVWINMTISTLTEPQLSYKRHLAMIEDISKRKQLEEDLIHIAERDHHIADVMQQIVLPSQVPITNSDYEIAYRYLPALTEAEVCGDFIDFFSLDENKIGIIIGDVVGKGLGSAVRIAVAKYAIKCYAYLDNRPSSVMSLVNEALCRNIMTEHDVLTAFYAILDVRTDTLTYSNAGHEPPLLRHSDGSVEYLTEGGIMFVGMGKYDYMEASHSLQTGDVVVLVTDGITEARKQENNYDFFGPEGIELCLSNNAGVSAEDIASSLLESILSFSNKSMRDDIAIIVIKKVS